MKTFKEFLSEGNIKVTCTRCDGSGKFSYNLMHGDMCYGCGGKGYVIRDEAKYKKAQAAKAKRDEKAAKKREEDKKNQAAKQEEWEKIMKKYDEDPRIGPSMRERMQKFEAVRFDVAKMLHQYDTKKNVHPSYLENIGWIPLDVPYKKKDVAKAAGAKWVDGKWQWNLTFGKMPKELEEFQ